MAKLATEKGSAMTRRARAAFELSELGRAEFQKDVERRHKALTSATVARIFAPGDPRELVGDEIAAWAAACGVPEWFLREGLKNEDGLMETIGAAVVALLRATEDQAAGDEARLLEGLRTRIESQIPEALPAPQT